MYKSVMLFVAGIFLSTCLFAQFPRVNRDSLNQLSSADHQLMMEHLGISSVRRGPSGNPSASNAANTDEAKVQPYFLPNPLDFNEGSKVTTPEQWEVRRTEIKELFDVEMYGRLPNIIPAINWKIVSIKDTVDRDFPVTIKQLEGVADNSSFPEIEVVIQLTVGTPTKSNRPVPTGRFL